MLFRRFVVVLLGVGLLCSVGWAAPLAKITVEAGDVDRVDTPVCVSPGDIDGGNVRLVEVKGDNRKGVASQVDEGGNLCWIVKGKTAAGSKRVYEIVKGESRKRDGVAVVKTDKHLDLKIGDESVLRYNHAIVPPPEGQSELYNRSGFIHPLWAPSQAVLTNIHPADHYHHVGLWMPWTKTHFEGRDVDFWNLKAGQGTVRFVEFDGTTEGPVFGGFKAKQEHVNLNAPGGEKVALNEVWDVRVWNTGGSDRGYWIVDFKSTQECASSSPLELPAYRYGGFGFRATDEWKEGNCYYLTSEGKNRKNGHNTRARWCITAGPTSKGDAGIVFMSHPSNRDYPEPMRIWPSGEVFFNWCPIQMNGWVLEPGNKYVFNYRMYIYNGKMTPEKAEQTWQDFGNPPKVTVVK